MDITPQEVAETLSMVSQQNLDLRTITMGISLMGCADEDIKRMSSKVYDRIYYRTDKWTYTYNLQDMEGTITIGELHDRLVPVVINYLPDNSSWIYIEQLAES